MEYGNNTEDKSGGIKWNIKDSVLFWIVDKVDFSGGQARATIYFTGTSAEYLGPGDHLASKVDILSNLEPGDSIPTMVVDASWPEGHQYVVQVQYDPGLPPSIESGYEIRFMGSSPYVQ